MDNYGTATQNYMGGASNTLAAPRQPRLDQLAERFEKSLSEFAELSARLQNVADRLLGPVPEAVDKNGMPPSPSATTGRLESLAETQGLLLRRLRQSTERLEVL